MFLRISTLIMIISTVLACSSESQAPAGGTTGNGTGANGSNGGASGWLIPQNQVFDGGPGKDGIPALSNPESRQINEISYLNDDDLVLGFTDGIVHKAYPHAILDWHEIVNDKLGDEKIAVTYCPLTGTGIGWSRTIQGEETTFGVSGLLYNTNLIPYDRLTDSNWCQISFESVNGALIGERADTYFLAETTWETWKQMYPESEVITENTGYSRTYGRYPYGDYRTNHESILFPVAAMDTRIPAKERVLTIVNDKSARVYRFNTFDEGPRVKQGTFSGKQIIIAGDKSKNYMVAFENNLNGKEQTFSAIEAGNGQGIFKDSDGNEYDLFGFVIFGPDKGARLNTLEAFMAYWFSLASFYPNVEIFGQN